MTVAAVLGVLGDDTRRGVVEALARQPQSAGELAIHLQVTPAALTRHLRLLRQAGIVGASLDEEDQRRHVYALRPEPLLELRDWADSVSEYWTRQLAAFAESVGGADADR